MVAAAVIEDTGPDYLDVDVIDENAGALPVGVGRRSMTRESDQTDELPLDFDEPVTEQPVVEEPVAGSGREPEN